MRTLHIFLLVLSSIAYTEPSLRIIPDQLYYPTLLKQITEAKDSIDILQYSFKITDDAGALKRDSEPYKIAEALIAAKAKNPNLKIRLYIESERSTAGNNKLTAKFLSDNGIEVKEGKTHAKGFGIDGKTLLLGSTNLTTQSMRYNNETNVLLQEDTNAVKAYSGYFRGLWDGKPLANEAFPTSQQGVQLLTNGKYKEELLKLIAGASKTIDFSIYYFNDPDIEKALIEASTKRKVKIRGYFNHHKSFAPDLVKRNKETMARMKEAGVTDLFLDKDTFFSHSKYLIADGEKYLLGTGNWNRSDIEEHPQLYLRVEDKASAEKLTRHLSHQIAYESDREIPDKLYYRFWVGNKKPELKTSEFDQRIRDRFVRATVKTGENGGLHAYLPALLAKPQGDTGKLIPDEVALVIYQDEPTYRAIRESPTGTVYGPLHMDYAFDTSSKSTVPEVYQGKVVFPKNEKGETLDRVAYDLSLPNINWQKAHSLFVFSPKKLESKVDAELMKKYLDRLKQEMPELDLSGYTTLIAQDYLIEYFSRNRKWDKKTWERIQQIRRETMGEVYAEPTHVEAAHKTEFENNRLTRPAQFPHVELTDKKGAGVVNSRFGQGVKSGMFMDTSQETFNLSLEAMKKLLTDIREAFVNNKPIPTKDSTLSPVVEKPIEKRNH